MSEKNKSEDTLLSQWPLLFQWPWNSKSLLSQWPWNRKLVLLVPLLIKRYKEAERDIWEKHIEPIVQRHHLRKNSGEVFRYHFIDKMICAYDVDDMVRKAYFDCINIHFPRADISTDIANDPDNGGNYSIDVVRRLRDSDKEKQEFCLKDGRKIDLRHTFRDFLEKIFEENTLPEFLMMLNLDGLTGEAEQACNVTDEKREENKSDVSIESKKEQLGESSGGAEKAFPCEPETKWEDIEITLLEYSTVHIKTPQGEGRYTYHELGMKDKRTNDKPTALWDILADFAVHKGYISFVNYRFDQRLPSRAKRLNAHLKGLFEINDSIYHGHYKKENAYRTKIKFDSRL